MRRTARHVTALYVLGLFLVSMGLTACTGGGSSLTQDQRERRAEELIEHDLSS